MEYRLSQSGAVCHDGSNFDPESFNGPHVKLSVPGALCCWTQRLGSLLFATTFVLKDREEHYITLFKHHGMHKPRCVQISALPRLDGASETEILKTLFPLLLSFDNGTLSNRNRNMLLSATRYYLPNTFKGQVTFNGTEYDYWMLTDRLTIFHKGTGKAVIRTNYQMFSRCIIKGIFK